MTWQAFAACAGKPVDWWFPDNNGHARAYEICRSCPVQVDCLEHALTAPEKAGIWGGTSEKHRARLLRRRRSAA
jgi:WhiB family redox-sensing transcriptional regulator